jgi:C1A family cysteine protease
VKGGKEMIMVSISESRFLSKVGAFTVILMSALIFYTIPPVMAQGSENVTLAPLNPAFLEYLQELQYFGAQRLAAGEHGLGHIPSPLDLSHLTGLPLFQEHERLGFSASYDLRTYGKVTPVKDQGYCGSCWAFAAIGSLESNLLTSETWDFSENNLKNTHGFDWGPCDGGNGDMATAYLARWSGPVSEADDHYNPSSNISPPGLTPRKHVQEVLIIPSRASSLDNDNIKQAVMTYGALSTSMRWEGDQYITTAYYNSTSHSYYYNGAANSNHGVAIVGWNDDFPASYFSTTPPGNGAFIIKNSWGAGWGENGYFYISYYDTKIGLDNYVFNGAEPTNNYSRVYQYDPLGWVANVGYSVNNAWFANIFTAAASEPLKAVSFYVASPISPYEIYIYTNAASGPRSGTLAGTKTGTISSPGYHTIVLNSSIPLTSGQRFSVVVKLTTPGYTYPIPMEYPIPGYSSLATAHAGESYISPNGSSWTDITTIYTNTNVCLKAFTAPAGNKCDFNGDGKTDILWRNYSTGQNSIWFMDGATWTGNYALLTTVTDLHWEIVGTGDFNNDGNLDILWRNYSTGQNSIWFMNGATWTGNYALLPTVPTNWQIVGTGYFNNDGKTDILWRNTSTGDNSIWFMDGATFTGFAMLPTVPTNWQIGGTGDFNNDGKTDILWRNYSTGQNSIWFMDGATFNGSYALLPSVSLDWEIGGPK